MDPTKKAMSLVNEFKAFALKGSVIDLAVGVIIGAAFGKIVDSLVKNIIMPLISFIMPSNQSYLQWELGYGDKVVPVGVFIGDVLNFVIVALALFLFIVKFLGWVMRTRKAEETAPLPPTKEEQLLMEIRDLLKNPPASSAPAP